MFKTTVIFSLISFYCIVSVECDRPKKGVWYLGNENEQNDRDRCIRRGNDTSCSSLELKFLLYRIENQQINNAEINTSNEEWLSNSGWNNNMETIILIHGYNGNPDKLPISILRDAYLNSARFNVIMMDWSELSRSPCYTLAVRNMDVVGRCASILIRQMQNAGNLISCAGHSLGAHICGITANHLTQPMHRIIGLDPAKPSIGASPEQHLDQDDARSVQMIITNAGVYGVRGGFGTLDVCINGGRRQPYCRGESNESLCSHVWSICYLAESLFKPKIASPCSGRCPYGRARLQTGPSIPIGDAAPIYASGMYCVEDNAVPFCPVSTNDIGDSRCCLRNTRH